METIWQIEIQITLFLQSLGDWLTPIMKGLSFLGNEEFYLIIMPFLYWCVNSTWGARVAIMMLLSNGLSAPLKLVFHSPRPYWVDPQVHGMISETSFGLPSGHAQNAASIWGALGVSLKKRWVTIGVIVVIFLIGLSRIFLGVHFTSDVLGGWLIGGLLILGLIKLEKPVVEWFKRRSFEQSLIVALGSSLLIILVCLLIELAWNGWEMPVAWIQNAVADTGIEPDPLNLTGIIGVAGTWLGMLGGVSWFYRRYGMFYAAGPGWKRIVRYFVGIAGVLLLWYGLGKIFPRDYDILSFSLRYLRYMLVGLWVAAAGPWTFIRIGLAGKPSARRSK